MGLISLIIVVVITVLHRPIVIVMIVNVAVTVA